MTFHIVSALVAAAELSIYSDVFGNCSSRALGLGSPLVRPKPLDSRPVAAAHAQRTATMLGLSRQRRIRAVVWAKVSQTKARNS